MKDEFNLWLSRQARIQGVLACAVFYPDRSTFCQSWAQGFETAALEKSMACLSDIWRLLRLNSLAGQWLRWGYSGGWFYGARREDGTVLGVITDRSEDALLAEGVRTFLGDFLQWNSPQLTSKPAPFPS